MRINSKEMNTSELEKAFSSFKKLCSEILSKSPYISYSSLKGEQDDLKGIGPSAIAQFLKQNGIKVFDYQIKNYVEITEDFAGFYLLFKDGKPKYCGISRNVLKRIADHTKGGKQSATFAHRLAMSDKQYFKSAYEQLFNVYKKELLTYEFKVIKFYTPCTETSNRYEVSSEHKEEVLLYFFEVFAAVYFKTMHNSFRTH